MTTADPRHAVLGGHDGRGPARRRRLLASAARRHHAGRFLAGWSRRVSSINPGHCLRQSILRLLLPSAAAAAVVAERPGLGTNALAHHAVDLVLHALNAALVARLAGLSQRTHRGSLDCGTGLRLPALRGPVRRCGCPTASTWLHWPSAWAPAGIRARAGSSAACPAPALLLLGALLSKETAYAVAGWLLLPCSGAPGAGASAVPTCGWPWLCRSWLPPRCAWPAARCRRHLPCRSPTFPAAALGGITAWWLRLPHALFAGFDEASGPVGPPAYVGSVLLALGGLFACALPRLRAAKDGSATLALTAPPCCAPPVAAVACHAPGAAAAGLRAHGQPALLLPGRGRAGSCCGAVAMPLPRARPRPGSAADAGCRWDCGAPRRRRGLDGAVRRRRREAARAGRWLAAREWPRGCRLLLDAASFNDDFRVHADTIAKAAAAPGAPLMSCAVFAGTRVVTTVVDGALCRAEDWPG